MAEQANAANIKIDRPQKNTKKLVAATARGNNFAKISNFELKFEPKVYFYEYKNILFRIFCVFFFNYKVLKLWNLTRKSKFLSFLNRILNYPKSKQIRKDGNWQFDLFGMAPNMARPRQITPKYEAERLRQNEI